MRDTQLKNERSSVLFAVYGTLKAAYGNHRLLRTATPKGEFQTEPVYTLFDGGFPIVERGGTTSIHCELYYTDDQEVIRNVFGLEGCSSQTKGNPNNWYDIDEIDTPHGKAVIFVMDKGRGDRTRIVESGNWTSKY